MKKYTLYIGLNDKDTKAQKIETLNAANIARNVILSRTDGGTIYNAIGFYTHADGSIAIENTLRIELIETDPDALHDIIETLKTVFNQESIILQTENVDTVFC